MAYNLKGFGSSIESLINIKYIIFFAITCLYLIAYIITKQKLAVSSTSFITFLACMIFFIFVNVCDAFPTWKKYYYDSIDRINFLKQNGKNEERWWGIGHFLPCWEVRNVFINDPSSDWRYNYIKQNSILHYGLASSIYDIIDAIRHKGDNSISVSITESEAEYLFSTDYTKPAETNLIIIIVESFESWPLENDSLSTTYAPNFSRFINNEHVLYCGKVKSQVRHGTSGDGQMILVSGLLPISTGSAHIKYGENVFPSIFKEYSHSALLDPTPNGSWNQKQMSKSYFVQEEFRLDHKQNDYEVFSNLNSILDSLESPFCALAMTVAMHLPFNAADTFEGLPNKCVTNLPSELQSYLNCMYLTDSAFGIFLDNFFNNSLLQNSTIVITGDHNVFKENSWRQYSSSFDISTIGIIDGISYCPLIIYSPNITKSTKIDNEVFQMDIFPTIQSLIGGNNFWQGFGQNLTDEEFFNSQRFFSEERAYDLSDEMIRSNYFLNLEEYLTPIIKN